MRPPTILLGNNALEILQSRSTTLQLREREAFAVDTSANPSRKLSLYPLRGRPPLSRCGEHCG